MNPETGQGGLTEADRNFQAPETSEPLSKEEVAVDALNRAAQATPESILPNPDQLAARFEADIAMWENEVRESEEVLARPDLSDSLRRDWERQLNSSQKNFDYVRQRYEQFKQRRDRAA